MTFGESLVFLVALLSGILDSIAAAGAHGDNLGTSSIGISALNQLVRTMVPVSTNHSSPTHHNDKTNQV